MIRSTTLVSIGLCGLVVALSGCNRADDERQRAAEAQQKADERIGKVEGQAQATATEAQQKADKEVAQAIQTANEKTAKAQTEANETIRAANENMLKARNDLREWAQKRLNDIDNDIDSSKTKAQKASSVAKANFERALTDVEKKRGDVQASLTSIDAQPAADLKDYKNRLEKSFDSFEDSVRQLDKAL